MSTYLGIDPPKRGRSRGVGRLATLAVLHLATGCLEVPRGPSESCSAGVARADDSESNRCFVLFDGPATWPDARDACKELEGDLAIELGSTENMLIQSLDRAELWIGATNDSEEGDWRWVDGDAVMDYRWAGGQPDNVDGDQNCLISMFLGSQWDDLECEAMHPYVCQF